MSEKHRLNCEEEGRCVAALHLLGIRSAEHPILRHRGYFALYLNGLHANEIDDGRGRHPSVQEFRELQRLLARAGVDRLRELLSADVCRGTGRSFSDEYQMESAPLMTTAPHLSLSQAPKSKFSGTRCIEPVKPPAEARERRKSTFVPETATATVEAARQSLEQGHYHDAYNVCADYLARHAVDEMVFEAAVGVIRLASKYDREKSIAPFNMLFECEELAQILSRHIPDMTALSNHADEQTVRMFRVTKMVYSTWTSHACALLEYRFKVNNRDYIQRQWIEPRDVGFLLDVMRVGVSSRLPLDLLRVIYAGARECIQVVQKVIPFEDKRAKFEGDALRILASPVKDVVPDMQIIIYKDIARAYLAEGDTATTNLFVDQGLLLSKKDRELLELKDKIREKISGGRRR